MFDFPMVSKTIRWSVYGRVFCGTDSRVACMMFRFPISLYMRQSGKLRVPCDVEAVNGVVVERS